MPKQFSTWRYFSIILLIAISFSCISCYSYGIATHAQEGTEMQSAKANSYLWGLVNKPPEIHTPLCDSLGLNGMTQVTIKKNFGQVIVTLLSLGICSPARIYWKCSKPCSNNADIFH